MSIYYLQDQLSERKNLDSNSFSTNQNYNEANSQFNNSLRDGGLKRRHLLDLNPMEEINNRCDDYSDINRSQTIENVLAASFINSNNVNNNSHINIKSNVNINLDQFKNGQNELYGHLEPSKLMFTSWQKSPQDTNCYQSQYLQPANQKVEEAQQLAHIKSGEHVPSLNIDTRLKSMDTFLPHSRSDAIEIERQNIRSSKLEIQNTNNHLDMKSEERKSNVIRVVGSKQHLTSNSKLNIDLRQEQRRKSKKNIQYFMLFKRTNLVNKFVNNIKNKASGYIFRRFKSRQFEILEDLSTDFQYYENKGLILPTILTIHQSMLIPIRNAINSFLDSSTFIIQPESIVTVIWEIFAIIAYLMLIIILPIDNNFDLKALEKYQFIHQIPLIIIPIEILLKLSTAVYKRGMIMENRRQIFKKFFKNDAKFDLTTLLIYTISQFGSQFNFLEYVITIKIIQVIASFKNLVHKFDREMKYSVLAKIVTLIIVILTFSHTQATIFVRIGLYERDQKLNSWIDLLQSNPTDTQIYISSIYWSIITMATIGYGDLHPVTDIEMIYVSIISLISSGIFGYSLNQIGQIVDSFEKKSEEFNRDMQILNKQMNQRNLNSKLQHKVRKYFEYLHKEDQIDDDKGNQMISNLPTSMKQNILFDINHKILYAQKAFSLNFSKQFLNLLALEMKTLKLGPEVDLFTNSETDDRCYFILKGQVEVYINLSNRQKTCYILKKGDMFGEIEFLCQQQRIKCAKTLNVVTLLYIDYKDFIRCIKNFDQDFEKYSMIKDKARLYNNLEGLDRKCLSCKKFNHQFVSCPQLQYWPNMDKLIHECNKSYFQERSNEIVRKEKNKINAIKEQRQVSGYINRIYFRNGEEEEDYDNDETGNNNDRNDETLSYSKQQIDNCAPQYKFTQAQTINQTEDYLTEEAQLSSTNIQIPKQFQIYHRIFNYQVIYIFISTNQQQSFVMNRNKSVSILENDILKRANSRKFSKKLSIKKDKKKNTLILLGNMQYDEEALSPSKRIKINLDSSQIDILAAGLNQSFNLQPTINSLTHINTASIQQQNNTLQNIPLPSTQVANQSLFSQQNQKQQQQNSSFNQPQNINSIQLIPQYKIQNNNGSNQDNNTNILMPQIDLDIYKTFSKIEGNHTNSRNTKTLYEGNIYGHSERQINFGPQSFDLMKIYKIYFPHNNVNLVIKRYQTFMKQTSSMYQTQNNKRKKLHRY
ncbi:zinc knuckle protein (macronuclear) [Tetrahymena thermophila SB210]|uniref:Zinc knuckle protein n=1 Tax=Tetrahymena thermophila (strain SB210) TaxID=312017 RepID=Q229S7_TETTS|nr:zinc knuckle protein [Tetrahymena thermophila SB210]EAR82048.2 zinc knuckle protein [Tetrahymena thermophila SB210]|eukprot:XP_001029711.2 zinc knuckle protein [Tetrahymena thermophila SB210]